MDVGLSGSIDGTHRFLDVRVEPRTSSLPGGESRRDHQGAHIGSPALSARVSAGWCRDNRDQVVLTKPNVLVQVPEVDRIKSDPSRVSNVRGYPGSADGFAVGCG